MRRYAMAEDGDERGVAKSRFDCKHPNKGGVAGYIVKYIAKNIDGYALDGERDHETGELLTDTAAAVTAWASTWRIPQFQFIGLPSCGAGVARSVLSVWLMSLTKPLRRCALQLMPVTLPLTFWHRVAPMLPATIRLCV